MKDALSAAAMMGGAYFLFNAANKPKAGAIKSLTQNWVDTVCTHNPQAVVDLYAPQGVLIGTVAKRIKIGREQIKTYFDTFLQKPQLCGVIEEDHVQSFAGWAIHSGVYTFSWVEKGQPTSLAARFSFVWKHLPTGWKIENHHSSAVP